MGTRLRARGPRASLYTVLCAGALCLPAVSAGRAEPPPPALPSAPSPGPPAAPSPRFTAYPAGAAYTGPHRLVLKARDRAYRTRLREAASQPADFAGHYVMALWGCGTECVMGAAINLRSGRVAWLPGLLCCWYSGEETLPNLEPVRYRRDSRLIILEGQRDERAGDLGRHYYRIEGDRFVHVADELRPGSSDGAFGGPPSDSLSD